jgi:hypothetical protein
MPKYVSQVHVTQQISVVLKMGVDFLLKKLNFFHVFNIGGPFRSQNWKCVIDWICSFCSRKFPSNAVIFFFLNLLKG